MYYILNILYNMYIYIIYVYIYICIYIHIYIINWGIHIYYIHYIYIYIYQHNCLPGLCRYSEYMPCLPFTITLRYATTIST